jgi:hypothetical protein
MKPAWLLAGLLCAGCAAPGAPSSSDTQESSQRQQPPASEEPIYFAIDLAAEPEFRAFLRGLAEEQPGLVFWAATLDNRYRQALGGDPACGARADDMRYRWANICRFPGAEGARLAVEEPDMLLGLPEQEILAMTSTPDPFAPIMLEASTVRLADQALEMTLRTSRLALPADFAGELEAALRDHVDEVLGTLRLRLELVMPAFARGVDWARPESDRCVPVDLYRVAEFRTLSAAR